VRRHSRTVLKCTDIKFEWKNIKKDSKKIQDLYETSFLEVVNFPEVTHTKK